MRTCAAYVIILELLKNGIASLIPSNCSPNHLAYMIAMSGPLAEGQIKFYVKLI